MSTFARLARDRQRSSDGLVTTMMALCDDGLETRRHAVSRLGPNGGLSSTSLRDGIRSRGETGGAEGLKDGRVNGRVRWRLGLVRARRTAEDCVDDRHGDLVLWRAGLENRDGDDAGR